MERIRFKEPQLERKLSMKGSKKKKRGPSICRENWKHQACIKTMRRGSRTQSAHKDDQKHQAHMNKVQRGSRALGARGECETRITNT